MLVIQNQGGIICSVFCTGQHGCIVSVLHIQQQSNSIGRLSIDTISIFIPLLLQCHALPASHGSSLHFLVTCTLTSKSKTITVHYVLEIQLSVFER